MSEQGREGDSRASGAAADPAADPLRLRHCRFRPAPPRRFLYPAILLLLAERPRHGYRLMEALPGLGLNAMDRPAVYRALADLAADGLIRSWDEAPSAGGTRHVYELTDDGVETLERWMSVVAAERATLEEVLQRHWYLAERRRGEGRPDPSDPRPAAPADFDLAPERSALTVEARSSVGPIAFCSHDVRGWVRVWLNDGLVSTDPDASGQLEVDLDSLLSGNTLYDRELQVRFFSRRYPTATVQLRALRRLGGGNCFRADGDITIRGVTRRLSGELTVTVHGGDPAAEPQDRRPPRLTVTGENILDLRDYGFEAPAMPFLRMYPDVRLRLHVEADARPVPA